VIEISLTANPPYPFSGNATLVRRVAANSAPVIAAGATVIRKPEKTLKDRQGHFVLFFMGTRTEMIAIEKKRRRHEDGIGTMEKVTTISTRRNNFP
jgi:hypothetical protein